MTNWLSTLPLYLHASLLPSPLTDSGLGMGRALVNGTLTNDTNRELEKWLFGGACPELLLEPCDRCPVNSLSHDHQVSVTELDMQQALGTWGLPWWLSGKEFACNGGAAGDVGSILGLGRSPGGWHGNPLQSSCLENSMDRGACRATVHRVAKSRTRLKPQHTSTLGT